MTYDLIILGAGAAGMRAALGASDMGLSALLVDRLNPGGGAVYFGFAALEGMLDDAETSGAVTHAVLAEKQTERAELLSRTMGHNLKTRQVDFVRSAVHSVEYGEQGVLLCTDSGRFAARNLLLAVGSVALPPSFEGAERAAADAAIHNERTFQYIEDLPEHVLVLGGEVRSLQLALYARLCGSKVAVLCPGAEIAPELDPEIAGILRESLQEEGVAFHLHSGIRAYKNGTFVVSSGRDGEERPASGILLCAGNRRPATRGLGLGELGILAADGSVRTDATGRTALAGVFAAGDCTGEPYNAYDAITMTETCLRSIAGRKHPPYRHIRISCMRRTGAAFSVGDTLEHAHRKRIRAAETKLPLPYASGSHGMVKLVADASKSKLIGAHLIGDGTEEIADELALAIRSGESLGNIRFSLFTPSAEITAEALYRLQRAL